MMRHVWMRQHRIFHQGTTMALVGTLLLSSCAAAPFLIPVAFEFARNLLQTSSQNYGSKYRDNMNTLVGRLASPYMQNLPPMAGGGPGMPGPRNRASLVSPGNRRFKASQACRNNNIPGNRPIQGKPAPTIQIIPTVQPEPRIHTGNLPLLMGPPPAMLDSRACHNNNIPGNRPIQGKPAPMIQIIPTVQPEPRIHMDSPPLPMELHRPTGKRRIPIAPRIRTGHKTPMATAGIRLSQAK